MTDQRPDPDALLRELKLKGETRTGKLKIFFGYAAGVGKTYAMLEAAHHAKEMGVDVVAGYIEPHVRPETLALLDGLEQLPNKEIPYKNITLREFDLDGALARKPQLILVDELAHTNAAGSRHRKRYQDLKELLRAGISVYTTVNVQHLESLNDVVASITGIAVAERLPDRIFDRADQVEVVDIEPADLLERLKEGKIYRPNQAARAMDHFFTLKNLAALREIALRRTADRLNRAADTGVGTKAKSSEHILVCLSGAPSNANVIRTAARMAEAFRSSFTALFVETSDFKAMSDDNRSRLRANLRLAEELGWAEAGRSFRFLLVQPRHPGKIIGALGFNEIVRGAFQSCFVSYKIDAALWGRGYGSEAIRYGTGWAFRVLGLHRAEANVMPRNAASLRAAEKAGYRPEGLARRYLNINGVWEDHIHMVKLNEEEYHA